MRHPGCPLPAPHVKSQASPGRARIAAGMVARCRDLTIQINVLERELRERAQALVPGLLAIPGCGVLGAAVSIGETARARPFRSKDAFARFTGTAPSPSGQAAAPGSPSQPRRQPA